MLTVLTEPPLNCSVIGPSYRCSALVMLLASQETVTLKKTAEMYLLLIITAWANTTSLLLKHWNHHVRHLLLSQTQLEKILFIHPPIQHHYSLSFCLLRQLLCQDYYKQNLKGNIQTSSGNGSAALPPSDSWSTGPAQSSWYKWVGELEQDFPKWFNGLGVPLLRTWTPRWPRLSTYNLYISLIQF